MVTVDPAVYARTNRQLTAAAQGGGPLVRRLTLSSVSFKSCDPQEATSPGFNLLKSERVIICMADLQSSHKPDVDLNSDQAITWGLVFSKHYNGVKLRGKSLTTPSFFITSLNFKAFGTRSLPGAMTDSFSAEGGGGTDRPQRFMLDYADVCPLDLAQAQVIFRRLPAEVTASVPQRTEVEQTGRIKACGLCLPGPALSSSMATRDQMALEIDLEPVTGAHKQRGGNALIWHNVSESGEPFGTPVSLMF
ncbi:hypothetical protein SKAU_G00004120 [Synaphobranchus kaupii]|uniref:Uncharacterized protein n=1 Tax=Synaphobranchus kaupii TaxID=118154 RepID=A0A9Q1JCW2_SYNKA|nr:hypothetical protein SKAU_G00004120 [Synaphobranchus kaupii]